VRITRVLHAGAAHTCVIKNDRLVPLQRVEGGVPKSWEVACGELHHFTELEPLPDDAPIHLPLVEPDVVLGAEDNFVSQRQSRKTGLAAMRPAALEPFRRPDAAEDVWLIPRDPRSLASPGQGIIEPRGCAGLDVGVALAVVSGPGGTVAGYSVALDVIRRDVPVEHAYLARSHPSHTHVAKVLCSANYIDDLGDAELSLRIDGEERQRAPLSEMVVQPATLLRSIYHRYRLPAGALVLMGTPPGTALDRGEGWITEGTVVSATITNIGEVAVVVTGEDQ
jgi:2-keto-4-pentenoate hydratase/2-oxohepta-3-ene-1,7-dioic acid hydratase in catechol pathway